MSIFDELQTSLQEAVEIKQGKAQASRITRHEVADVSRVDRAIARPGPPQIRTCAIDASGSSIISFAEGLT